MHIIYNRYFPFGSFWAINIFGIIFARSQYGQLSPTLRNHEHIHTIQQKEMLILPFYVWYVCEYLLKLLYYRNSKKAYRNISFEREAYLHQSDPSYPIHRKHFAWIHLI